MANPLDPCRIFKRDRQLGTAVSRAFAEAARRRWPGAARARERSEVRECFRNSRGVDPDAGRW